MLHGEFKTGLEAVALLLMNFLEGLHCLAAIILLIPPKQSETDTEVGWGQKKKIRTPCFGLTHYSSPKSGKMMGVVLNTQVLSTPLLRWNSHVSQFESYQRQVDSS